MKICTLLNFVNQIKIFEESLWRGKKTPSQMELRSLFAVQRLVCFGQ